IGSFLSSFFPTTHADTKEQPASTQATSEGAAEEPKEEAAAAEEPEDEHPAIRAACEERADCAPLKHHFEKCQAKVQVGEGFKAEDCMEETC
ncbi:Non-heme 11 kDa protein of cytochrome bc1 complex, partial [Mycena latifolia]